MRDFRAGARFAALDVEDFEADFDDFFVPPLFFVAFVARFFAPPDDFFEAADFFVLADFFVPADFFEAADFFAAG